MWTPYYWFFLLIFLFECILHTQQQKNSRNESFDSRRSFLLFPFQSQKLKKSDLKIFFLAKQSICIGLSEKRRKKSKYIYPIYWFVLWKSDCNSKPPLFWLVDLYCAVIIWAHNDFLFCFGHTAIGRVSDPLFTHSESFESIILPAKKFF